MVHVKWLRDAKTDLKEIFDYISLDSKRYARLQVEKIQQRTKVLKSHPRLGKTVKETGDPQINPNNSQTLDMRIVNYPDD